MSAGSRTEVGISARGLGSRKLAMFAFRTAVSIDGHPTTDYP
jgi:hypothetical protein